MAEKSPTLITIDPERYTSPDFVQQEKQKLWPKVWQVACREEELPSVGSYITYEICDESVIVVRGKSGEIAAFHNVCPHRGRRLAQGCGKTAKFRCGYHGWMFDLEGENIFVQDKEDWAGALDDQNLNLHRLRVDTWGGFVFVHFEPEGESLAEYLGEVPSALGPLEYENMRYRWYLTVNIPANWKVALEAFNEGYHVAATHPQLLPTFGDDYTYSRASGLHSCFGYERNLVPSGAPSPRTNLPVPEDGRENVMRFFEIYEEQLKAMFTERDYKASQMLMQVLPEPADLITSMITAIELGRKAAEDDGVGYPKDATFEHFAKAGADWHVFPNLVTLYWFDGALVYRARPDGEDPNKCIFDIWSLTRYAKDGEPPLVRQVNTDPTQNSICEILDQDVANMIGAQKGMKSAVFGKCKPNPHQEIPVINFHRAIDEVMSR